MADFDDSADPALGEACNRLAAWVEPLPEGVIIDTASGLTERDLAMILRRLYDVREYRTVPLPDMQDAADHPLGPSEPPAKKGPWG